MNTTTSTTTTSTAPTPTAATATTAAAATMAIGGPNPIVGFRGRDIVDSVRSVVAEAARNPRHAASSLAHLANTAVDIVRGRATLRPAAKDRRFTHSAWSTHLIYRGLVQLYLAAGAELDSWLGGTELQEIDRERARFVLYLLLDALAPSNLPVNPVALEQFVSTRGSSAVNGLRQFVTDVRHNGGLPNQVDSGGFEVGRNLATTPGAVVFRNEVLELIQYSPNTERVHGRPLVIAPPQINKFYVFDLSQSKSPVRFLVDGGMQVFMVSWRNPTAEHRDWDLGTYLQALEQALDVVCEITGSDEINLAGACSGGITSVASAAILAARERHRVNTLTLLVSVFDLAELRSPLGLFASEATLAAAKRRSHVSGVLDGRELCRVFSLLRPNDLIWPYWVNNYLLGNKPPAFDVLFWNNDTTRLPAALHAQLIDIYQHNSLAEPGAVTVNGTPIDLGRIDCDAFVLAGTTDHITPWQACYRSALRLAGDVEFTLSNSGHIQSILNPPGNPKAKYFVNPGRPASAENWRAGATEVAGSWWPRWLEWLGARSGELRPAPATLGGSGYAPLEPAPGSYVRR